MLLTLVSFCMFLLVNIASAQVQDTVLKPADTLKYREMKPAVADTAKNTDSLKAKYINPGKVAGRRAVFKSMIIPGWGQLYNNQLLVNDLNAKGERTGHFWQKTYTLSKIGVIYAGFTLLTLSYIDNTNNYKILLKEAQYRDLNPGQKENPDLSRYSNSGILSAKDVYKRNRQVIIFSYIAVYAINIVDAYVAARLHYFDVGDKLSFRVSPSLLNQSNNLYGFNAAPGLKLALTF